MVRGTIASLAAAHGTGSIARERVNQRLPFHKTEVEGCPFDALQIGQVVEFAMGVDPRNPRQPRAERVRVVEE